jgi:hypothetical protein
MNTTNETENISYNMSIENKVIWYKRRTEEEIKEKFEYYGVVKDDIYYDVYFKVPEQYWVDLKNKQKDHKIEIINKEFYGYILEKVYPRAYTNFGIPPINIHFIIKRYKKDNTFYTSRILN